MSCSVCDMTYHLQCIPRVSRNDSVYQDRLINRWICLPCNANLFPFNSLDDDDEFNNVIRDIGIHHVPPQLADLNDICFNPIDINDDDLDLGIFNSDPDLQYYNDIQYKCDCKYYTEDSFNIMYKSLSVNVNNLSVIHSNIRSIPKNLGKCLVCLLISMS